MFIIKKKSIYIYRKMILKKQRHCFDSWFMGLDVAFFAGIVKIHFQE